jgi:hypothetical protein
MNQYQGSTPEQLYVAKFGYEQYLATPGDIETTPGMFLWYEDMIYRSPKSSYQLAAGSCALEAALHPGAPFELEDRFGLIEGATLYWDRAFEAEKWATNDIAERAKWALCQVPMFRAIATFIEGGEIQRRELQATQEMLFREHLNHLLQRWDHEQLDGHAMEVLTSYFPHRSNRMRPNELPIYSVPSSLRYDYHPQANRRVDVDTYDLRKGIKYGIQVKGGKVSNPDSREGDDLPLFRIFFNKARRYLCLPATEWSVRRTIEAIASDDPRYRDSLDTIAADNRARITRHFDLPKYVGVSVLRRGSSAGKQ